MRTSRPHTVRSAPGLRPGRRAVAAACCAVALVAGAGCGSVSIGVDGSGTIRTETRSVEPFTAVRVAGSMDAVVTVGEPQPGTETPPVGSLTVTSDDNVLPVVRTTVDGGTLIIDTTGTVSPSRGILVQVATSQLVSSELDGSGSIAANGVAGERFGAVVAGSGTVTANGRVDRADVDITGSGDARLFDLAAADAQVRISGSGTAEVTASSTLTATVTGSGDVLYGGSPMVTKTVTGSGEVRPRT